MSKEKIEWLKPFISVLFIISSLLIVVFFKMEVRRMGYTVWKKSQALELKKEEHQSLAAQAIKRMRPDRIHQIAQFNLELSGHQSGQMIQMSQDKIALRLNR